MIRLGLRLGLAGDRQNVVMAAITTAAVAAGTALLLLALTVAPAMQARADRTAWTNAGFGDSAAIAPPGSDAPHTTYTTTVDTYRADRIELVLLAAAGDAAPVPPGIPALPAPGQVFVSPALKELMEHAPRLAVRYGSVVGTVDERALAGPDALLAVRGVTAADVASTGTAVIAFPTSREVPELTSAVVKLLLLLGAVATILPVALLVVLATRLSAATRNRRLAALRLAGATRGQVARLAAVESLVAGVGGVVVGCGLFFAVRPLATYVTYDGGRWFADDLTPPALGFLAVGLGVPLVTAVAAQATLARVVLSPLGVARRTTPRPVRVWRLVPLALAVVLLGAAMSLDATAVARNGDKRLVPAAFAVLLVTLIYAGPWITRAVGLILARSRGPARLLAGRRLTVDPQAGSRAVAGVVLAVLVTTMFIAITPAAAESLRDTRIIGQQEATAQARIHAASPAESAALLEDVRAVTGVSDASLVYEAGVQDGSEAASVWIGDCTQIAAAAHLAALPCGQAPILVAANRQHLTASRAPIELDSLASAEPQTPGEVPDPDAISTLLLDPAMTTTMPAQLGIDVPQLIVDPSVLGQALAKLRPTLLLARYEGQAALEQVRTLVMQQVPDGYVATRDSTYEGFNSDVRRLYRVLTIATAGVFGVVALGLVVALATGLLERRRPFALLRASGAPLRTLRRTVFLEASTPLAAMAVLSAVLGALVGRWTVTAGGQSHQLPWLALTVPVAAGLAVSLLLIGCALPLVRRATSTEETRFE